MDHHLTLDDLSPDQVMSRSQQLRDDARAAAARAREVRAASQGAAARTRRARRDALEAVHLTGRIRRARYGPVYVMDGVRQTEEVDEVRTLVRAAGWKRNSRIRARYDARRPRAGIDA